MRYVLAACAFLFSCGSDNNSGLIPGFNPPAPPPGYTRFVTPAIHNLQAGADEMYCQWVAAAGDADLDVIDVRGAQTKTGHHAVLYSTSDVTTPLGTSRPCTPQDMLSVEFLGGIGGEGVSGSVTQLPPGVVFRLHKGRALMANVHYLNATGQTIDAVQSVIDVKMQPPSSAYKAAGMTGINFANIAIPPGGYSVDAYCNWPIDASLVMWSDHEHMHGSSIYSEVKHADGTVEPLAQDPSWTYEEAFNPKWVKFDVGAPRIIKAGDQVHVHCEWTNDGSTTVRFPDEMCVALGFYLENSEMVICDGQTH